MGGLEPNTFGTFEIGYEIREVRDVDRGGSHGGNLVTEGVRIACPVTPSELANAVFQLQRANTQYELRLSAG